MNKLLLLALLGTLLALVAAGSEQQEEQAVLDRTAREAARRPKKGAAAKHRRNKPKYRRNKPKFRKNKPKGNIRKNNEPRANCRQAMNYTCLENAMFTLKMMKDNVNNYLKQEARTRRANKTGGSKSGKKGLFGPVLHQIVEAGGGNKSALSCNGATDSAGAKQLTNLTETLKKCEKTIESACDPSNFPMPNNTEVMGCMGKMTEFKGLVDNCLTKSGEEACTCWLDEKFPPLQTSIKGCKLADDVKAVTAQLGYCRGNFSYCKKFEDESLKAISSCSTTSDKLLVKAKALTANVNSLTAAKTTATSLAGNSSRHHSGKRATATSCAEIIEKITTMLTYVEDNPTSPLIVVIAAEITEATGVTCSDTEKTSLNTQVASIETSIVTVTEVLATVQTNLELVSGSTASPSAIGAATDSPTSTAAASGRRNIVARHLMNRLNLH